MNRWGQPRLLSMPADKCGIKVRDIIVQVDNYRINDQETLISVFQEFRVGQKVKIKLLRNDKEITTTMTLSRR